MCRYGPMSMAIDAFCSVCGHLRCVYCMVATIKVRGDVKPSLHTSGRAPSHSTIEPEGDQKVEIEPEGDQKVEIELPHVGRQPLSTNLTNTDGEDSDIESIFSGAPSLGSSQTSAMSEVDNSALYELRYLLLHNEQLRPLYGVAMTRVGPERFHINLRRLLRNYGRDLEKEARTYLQTMAAGFVRVAARRLSVLIKEAILNNNGHENGWGRSGAKSKLLGYLKDLPDSDDDSDYDPDEAALETLKDVKTFMLQSTAFLLFHSAFRAWLKLDTEYTGQVMAARETQSDRARTSIPRENGLTMSPDERPRSRPFAFTMIWKYCRNAILDFCQQDVPPGQFRVSWTCRCGDRLRLQVPESHAKAAKAFATQAAGSNTDTLSCHSHGTLTAGLPSSSNQASVNSGAEMMEAGASPVHSPYTSLSGDDSEHEALFIPAGTKKFLLLCVNIRSTMGRRLTKLVNVDVTDVANDGEMFQRLNNAYHATRTASAWNPFVKPKTMQYIRFQLLFLQKSGEVVGSYEANSIPSTQEVMKQEYSFRPCPPKIGDLPMPPHIFMHMFLDPGDHLGLMAVELLPKKLWAELRWHRHLNSSANIPGGWGFLMVEGIRDDLVRVLVVVLLILVTILVATWSAVMNDVQGATGLGQYCLALLAIVTSVLFWQWSI
ncbi:Putative protein of unknown function [Podospora comata]|uniref:Uncharacterized protein n=1 Tax=Podospora comata TaxID=48703 RepID=A0ABY6RZF4_PODCO|nr:Putative protein of unknown function [Podospora comata]